MTASELANSIGAKPSGAGYIIQCPVHDDKTPLYNSMIVNTMEANIYIYILSAMQVVRIKTYKHIIEL